MNILFVSSYFLPYVSGLTIHAQRLAEGMAKKGHKTEILTNKHKGDLPSQEKVGRILVKRATPCFRLSRGFFSPHLFFLFTREVLKKDVVVLHLPMPESFIFAPLAKILRKKVFLIYHANLNLPSWSIFSKAIEALVYINHWIAGLFADNIIAYSKDYANHARFLVNFKQKVVIISPPVFMRNPRREESAQWRKRLDLERTKIIGFAGRFAEEKGGDILLQALGYLAKKEPKVRVVFAGERNLSYENFYQKKRDLIDKYKNRILFIEVVAPEKMPEFYSMIDVLALPSRFECFGLVQVEAMLCGTPVVAFNIPGGRVPLQMSGMGKLANKADIEDFANCLIQVINKKDKFLKKKSEIQKIFNLEKSISKYEAVFYGKTNLV